LAIINIQLEKTQISARTPGHWRNRKVVESMLLSSWIGFVTHCPLSTRGGAYIYVGRSC